MAHSSSSGIQYDNDGFIIGQVHKKVDHIDDNILKILKILQGKAEQTLNSHRASELQIALHEANNAKNFEDLLITARQQLEQQNRTNKKERQENNTSGIDTSSHQSNKNRGNRSSESIANESSSNDSRSRISSNGRTSDNSTSNPSIDNNTENRNRDSKGRFTTNGNTISTTNQLIEKLGRTLSGFTPSQGYDPTVDAINELGTALSPVKKAASFVFRPLTALAKLRKRAEPLPQQQTEHNRKQLRILQLIADRTGSGSHLGGLGKLLTGGTGLASKLLKKGRGLPIIGGVVSALTLANWDEKTTEEKGGALGTLSGGAIGAMAGSAILPGVGTVIGGVIGAWVGDELGTVVAPYVKNWTDNLTRSDIPKQIIKKWDDFVDGAKEFFNNSIKKMSESIDRGKETANNWYNSGKSTIGGWLDSAKKHIGLGNSNGTTVNQEPTGDGKAIKRFIEAGPRYNLVELEDGSIIRQTGNFNHRNRNPGNIERGKFADSLGALRPEKIIGPQSGADSPGRFALFPTLEMGRKAKEHLLFESSDRARYLSTQADYGRGLGYKDKTLMQAIASWAPPEDKNDTAKYQRNVLAAVSGQNKRMQDYTASERQAILNAMEREEGRNNVVVEVVKPPTKPVTPSNNVNTTPPLRTTPQGSKPLADFANSAEMPKITSLSNFAPTAQFAPASIIGNRSQVTTQRSVVPAIEPVLTRITAKDPQKVVIVNSGGNDTISQNVGDRAIAHAITGGIGEGFNA